MEKESYKQDNQDGQDEERIRNRYEFDHESGTRIEVGRVKRKGRKRHKDAKRKEIE